MRIKDLMLFAYDFKHKKTQDFIFRLLAEGYNIKYLIAAPWEKLEIPAATIKTAPSHTGLLHPKQICQKFNIEYFVSKHNSKKTIEILENNKVDLYVISGARILNKDVIKACDHKVLNIHPGLLPEVRGLDTLPWSIHYDKPIGITSHFISPIIDSGKLIIKEELELKNDDTIIDVSLRLLEKQNDILIDSLNQLRKGQKLELPNLDEQKAIYNSKMPENIEKTIYNNFDSWLTKHSKNHANN